MNAAMPSPKDRQGSFMSDQNEDLVAVGAESGSIYPNPRSRCRTVNSYAIVLAHKPSILHISASCATSQSYVIRNYRARPFESCLAVNSSLASAVRESLDSIASHCEAASVEPSSQ